MELTRVRIWLAVVAAATVIAGPGPARADVSAAQYYVFDVLDVTGENVAEFISAAINNNGDVVFSVLQPAADGSPPEAALFLREAGQPPAQIAEQFTVTGDVVINDAGDIVFISVEDDGALAIRLVEDEDPLYTADLEDVISLGQLALSADGTLVFWELAGLAQLPDVTHRIRSLDVKSAGEPTVVAESGGDAMLVLSPAIDDEAAIAYLQANEGEAQITKSIRLDESNDELICVGAQGVLSNPDLNDGVVAVFASGLCDSDADAGIYLLEDGQVPQLLVGLSESNGLLQTLHTRPFINGDHLVAFAATEPAVGEGLGDETTKERLLISDDRGQLTDVLRGGETAINTAGEELAVIFGAIQTLGLNDQGRVLFLSEVAEPRETIIETQTALMVALPDEACEGQVIEAGDSANGVLTPEQSSGLDLICSATDAGGPDAWYQFTAEVDGYLLVNTCGTSAAHRMSTVLSVHPDCKDEFVIDCNVNAAAADSSDPCACGPGPEDAAIAHGMTAGQSVWVRVAAAKGGAGDFILNAAFSSEEPSFVPGDINDDCVVDVDDLLILLANWGACPNGEPCAELGDINEDGVVNVDDLLILLANWG